MNGRTSSFQDKNGRDIYAGDILVSDDDFFVSVEEDKDGYFYGSLISGIDHPCRNIPYNLNNGQGYRIVFRTWNYSSFECSNKN